MKSIDPETLPQNHDLTLPAWGPYSKKYFGISHIADEKSGGRFDFTVIPALYRRALAIPDALRPSGGLPWQTSADLANYSYRQQLEWQDRIYCDISFFAVDAETRLVRCELVNNTDELCDMALHLLSTLDFDQREWVEPVGADEWAEPEMQQGRGVEFDAMHPGEMRRGDAVGGSAYRLKAGESAVFHLKKNQPGKHLYLRMESADGIWANRELVNRGGADISFRADADCVIDGLVSCGGGAPEFRRLTRRTGAMVTEAADGMTLDYPEINRRYHVSWAFSPVSIHRYEVDNLNDLLLYNDAVHQHYLSELKQGTGREKAVDAVLQPLAVPAHGRRVLYFTVSSATERSPVPSRAEEIAKGGAAAFLQFPAQLPYAFSQERMAAVVMTNVVYPTRMLGHFVRHHSPGKRWNSLYTWDSGFIGLGMLELDVRRAAENLNAYLTEPADQENAFILHGTPLPVQIYLLAELWNRTCDRELLRYFYPRARHFYRYLAGHDSRSLTRSHSKAALICTWDYFYNSGGWDDYPPQLAMHRAKRNDLIPAVGTSHVIRAAKLLANMARELGEDASEYEHDIDDFSASLQRYAWDGESGYFGYVKQDEAKNPTGIFRTPDGVNYNMGLDGASPLVAGCCTGEQRRMLWNKLASDEHCWSDAGLSTVDRSAPYYRADGYWNGAVWMAHQWFFWKAALSDGQADFAWQIADTALKLWEKEVRSSYACYEQFPIQSGRGGGWHHFGGLSSPVLNWYGAYYRPGRLTAGFDVRIKSHTGDGNGMEAKLEIAGQPQETTTVIAVCNAATVEYGGKMLLPRFRLPGVVEVDLPKGSSGKLVFC